MLNCAKLDAEPDRFTLDRDKCYQYEALSAKELVGLMLKYNIFGLTKREADYCGLYLTEGFHDTKTASEKLCRALPSIYYYSRNVQQKTKSKSLCEAMIKIDRAIMGFYFCECI